MSTYQILSRLWKYVNSPRHPLVRFETRRLPTWDRYLAPLRRFYRYAIRAALVLLFLATIMEVMFRSRVSFMLTLIMLAVPLIGILLLGGIMLGMVGWQVPIAMAGSAVIVHERAERTWDLLLTTPVPHADVLLAKLAVGLARYQTFITLMTLLQVVPLIAVLGQISRATTTMQGIEPILLTLLVIGLFTMDRLQQFVLAGLLGLASSLLADTWPLAVMGAVALGAVLWLLHTMIAFGLAIAAVGTQSLDVGQVLVVGFPSIVSLAHPLWLGVLILVAAILLQEWLVRRIFTWLLWRVVAAR